MAGAWNIAIAAAGLLALSAGQLAAAMPAPVTTPVSAKLIEPTDRYGHDVLGGNEYAAMAVTVVFSGSDLGQDLVVRLPEDRVFEDVAARLADIDGDAVREIVVVESSRSGGAEIAIYALQGTGPSDVQLVKTAATPPIGQRNRWRAIVAIADLNGDGSPEIAEVDRPHLAGILRVWTYRSGRLVPLAERAGFSNHRIGEPVILSGARDCAGEPELALPDFGWRGLVAARLAGASIEIRPLGHPATGSGLVDALACEEG